MEIIKGQPLAYVEKLTEPGVAIMNLNRRIGPQYIWDEDYVDGPRFADEMYALAKNDYKVRVNVNSPGGNVYNGFDIIQAVIDTQADTHLVGIAYSMAGYIYMFGKHKTANSFGVMMFHMARIDTDDEEIKKTRQPEVDIMNQNFLNIITGKLSDDKIQRFKSGEDIYVSATEAEKFGIINETLQINPPNSMAMVAEAKLPEIYKKIEQELYTVDMEAVNRSLGIKAAASESATIEAIKDLQAERDNKTNEVKDLRKKLKDLEAENEDLKTQVEETNRVAAESFVNEAVEAGKITEESKAQWTKQAVADLEGTKELLKGLDGSPKHQSAQAYAESGGKGKTETQMSNKECYEFYIENVDGGKLDALAENQPEKYEAVVKGYNAHIQALTN